MVLVQMLVRYLRDRLQSAAGYLMCADKRMELGDHLRKLPMGYFTVGNFKRSCNTALAFERKMTPWTVGLNLLYGIGIASKDEGRPGFGSCVNSVSDGLTSPIR